MIVDISEEIAQILRWLTPFAVVIAAAICVRIGLGPPKQQDTAKRQPVAAERTASRPEPTFAWISVLSGSLVLEGNGREVLLQAWPPGTSAYIKIKANRPIFTYFIPTSADPEFTGTTLPPGSSCLVGAAKKVEETCAPSVASVLMIEAGEQGKQVKASVSVFAYRCLEHCAGDSSAGR